MNKKSFEEIIEIINTGTNEERKQVKEQLALMIDKLKSSRHSSYINFKVYCSIQNLHDGIRLE
jgi:hypothetical protein